MKAHTPTPYNGLLETYREIIPALRRMAKDPDYYVQRTLPPPVPQTGVPYARPAITSEGKRVVDGWIEVGSSGLLLRGKM